MFYFNEILLIYQKREVLFSFGMEFFSCCLRDGHWMHMPDVDRVWKGNLLLGLITFPYPWVEASIREVIRHNIVLTIGQQMKGIH